MTTQAERKVFKLRGFTMDPETLEKLADLANWTERSKSGMLRHLVIEAHAKMYQERQANNQEQPA